MRELLPLNSTPLLGEVAELTHRSDSVRNVLQSLLMKGKQPIPGWTKALNLDESLEKSANAYLALNSSQLLPAIWSNKVTRTQIEDAANKLELTGVDRLTSETKLRQQFQEACILSDARLLLQSAWHPELCPEFLLPWLAWSLSVDEWDEAWSLSIKRQVVKDAFTVHQLKGTPYALQKALESLNISTEIKEWWQVADNEQLSKDPGTVTIWALINRNLDDTATGLLTDKMLKRIRRVIDAVKRGSIHIDIRLGLKLQEQLSLSGVLYSSMGILDTDGVIQGIPPEASKVQVGVAVINEPLLALSQQESQLIGVTPEKGQMYGAITGVKGAQIKACELDLKGRMVRPNSVFSSMQIGSAIKQLALHQINFQGVC